MNKKNASRTANSPRTLLNAFDNLRHCHIILKIKSGMHPNSFGWSWSHHIAHTSDHILFVLKLSVEVELSFINDICTVRFTSKKNNDLTLLYLQWDADIYPTRDFAVQTGHKFVRMSMCRYICWASELVTGEICEIWIPYLVRFQRDRLL